MSTWMKCAVTTLILVAASHSAAQLAPTGEHYAGRASDTGYGGTVVNATATIGAAIPLEFPLERSGVAIPLQITYGARGVGAAGLGWDMSLSYIQHNKTFAHRRPASNPGDLPSPRARTSLSLFGQTFDLVADGNAWFARSGTLELTARESAGAWQVFDGRGSTYTFQRPPGLDSTGLWLLKTVSMPGQAGIELIYQITTWPLDGGVGTAIDLIRIDYNAHPMAGCAKNEIALTYGNGSIKPVSLSMLGDRVMVRKNTLTRVDVSGRATCATPFERLRRYVFQYQPDEDTHLPRLRTVQMFGRQGTAEENMALPVATYDYGSATRNGVLQYRTTQTIPMPAGALNNQISGTGLDSSVNAPVSGDRYAMWQTLTDVTGDGRPDLVFKKNNKLWVAFNRPGANGGTTVGVGAQGIVQLADATFANGAFATHTSVMRRFDYAPANRNTTNVWRQAIDVNGDGRIDIIDAAEQPDQWVVYLNTPGGPTGIKWVRRSFSVIHLRQTLVSSGHVIEGPHVPLSRRSTGTDIKTWECWRWNGTQWQWFSQGFSNHRCEGVEQQVVERGSERTFVEWQLIDLNGDGYPDFVFNSSPVDFRLDPPPSTPTPVTGAVWPADFGIGGPLWEPFSPRPTNEIRGSLNVRGVRFDTNADPFARSFNLFAESAEQGVGQWKCVGASPGAPCDESFQSLSAGFVDVNGDGLVDRVVGNRAYLGAYHGTAVVFSHVYITLPGPLETQHNTHKEQCVAGGTQKPTSNQTQGLRDLTGDGIPDYFDHGKVWIGTGTGFRESIDITTQGANFNFSHETETCNGDRSNTDGGLFDIDGDGRPEVIGLGGSNMFVSALVGAQTSGAPEAGRLTSIDNGYGAKTSIVYVSTKLFTDNPVPFPEIVVSSVTTTATQNPGVMLAGARYAYGNAELVFDSALDRFSFPGYRRRVEIGLFDFPAGIPGAGNGRLMGAATITDNWPLVPFNPGLNKQQRWLRAQKTGHVRDVFTLRAFADPDPWSLLGVDINDARVIGVSHHEYDAKLFEAPLSSENAVDCLEMFLPLDFALSFGYNLGANGLDACRTHGFAFETITNAWYGASAPPSNNNIQTRSQALAVDDFGRVTRARYAGDLFRSDDDVCVENGFAVPNGTFPRVLTALASWRVTDCNKRVVYAAKRWSYDGLAPGVVANGFVTAHEIERRATDNGALLRTVHAFDATYDAAGNMVTVSTQRDGSTRTVTLDYDLFGLVPIHSTIAATSVPSLEVSASYDPVSLAPLATIDASQAQHGSDYDGFGRLARSTVRPPGGQLGVVSTLSYEGFAGNDPDGRRIAITAFSDPVAPANVGSAQGRTGTVFLDELGRARRTELALGSDYANELLVVGSRTYDAFGRVVFQADPHPGSQDPATVYGSTYHFKNTGDVNCVIRGRGPQALAMSTDIATERFPTCFTRSFVNHVETLEMRDAASLQAGAPQAGVVKRLVSSAIGRPIEASTVIAGTRLDYATFFHDRLGQQTSMTRFRNPAGLDPVQWSWRLDSIGQMLQLAAPETAIRAYTYSDWGEPVGTRWTDGIIDRQLVRMYDAMGRVTATDERANGIVDPETVTTYDYDNGVVLSPQVTPTFVRGRLARASSPSGQVAFSYDGFGRINAQTFVDPQGGIYVQKFEYHADDRLAFLEFDLPDAGFAPETVKYAYDSAGRMRTMSHADTTGVRELYGAETVDPLGRVRKARYGGSTVYFADYASEGRRLPKEVGIESSAGSRRVMFLGYDALGRETSRREITDAAAMGPKTNVAYDALGRLAMATRTDGAATLFDWSFSYDALGNLVGLKDLVGTAGAALSYRTIDRDRVCRIAYGAGGLGGTACNVTHDVVGNIVREPTRTGTRELDWFASGKVRAIDEPGVQARFRYDAFGVVQELNVQGGSAAETRNDRRYGGLLERHDEVVGTSSKSILVRQFPGPNGVVASRRGAGGPWVFPFGEERGNRFFTDANGAFVQDVDYQPFGESKSNGVPSGSAAYTQYQWNGGDALASFGLVHLGARIYDPVIGRFLSRDPLLIPRMASTTNPYAFAMNDPFNSSDPSGLDDCLGKECHPDTPIIPLGPIINAIGGLFGGGSGGPPAAPPISPQLAKAMHDEAMYQAEQARICAKDANSHFCDTRTPEGSPVLGAILSPFTSAVGVPSYYIKTEVSRAGMLNAQTGVEYFAARDQYNAARANIALTRIREETARYFGAAMSLSGAMMGLGAAGSRSAASPGSRIPPNARPGFNGGGGGPLTYKDGYERGAAASAAGEELVLGKFPSNVDYVAKTPGTVTLDVPSGWTPTYNAGFIRGFMDGGGQIRLIPGEFSGTFRIEVQQVLTIPGAP